RIGSVDKAYDLTVAGYRLGHTRGAVNQSQTAARRPIERLERSGADDLAAVYSDRSGAEDTTGGDKTGPSQYTLDLATLTADDLRGVVDSIGPCPAGTDHAQDSRGCPHERGCRQPARVQRSSDVSGIADGRHLDTAATRILYGDPAGGGRPDEGAIGAVAN